MKSIEDTLTLVNRIVREVAKTIDVDIALIGGYAVIAHGVGRTTMDVDFLIYSSGLKENSKGFRDLFIGAVPGNFEINWVEGSKMLDDPFPYDIIFLTDQKGEYPRMDFVFPRYKWELEGLKQSKPLGDLPFPVFPAAYLIAMKLRAGSHSDNYDIAELYNILSVEEKEKTAKLAATIKRDKKLAALLEAREMQQPEPEDQLL